MVHCGGAFALVVKSKVTRSAHRPPEAATARKSAGPPVFAVMIGSMVPTPWHATVVVVTATVVEVVGAGAVVVGATVTGTVVVDSGVAAGLSELLHAAARGSTTRTKITRRCTSSSWQQERGPPWHRYDPGAEEEEVRSGNRRRERRRHRR